MFIAVSIMISRKHSTGTTHIKKRASQWEKCMKQYSEKHKEKCNTDAEKIAVPAGSKDFPTGSSYDGEFDVIGMSGFGEYTFPNGVVYRGRFHDGFFHGNGELLYKEGNEEGLIVQGNWIKGMITERKVLFSGLEYAQYDWKYCNQPDRRYSVEFESDLQPAGNLRMTPEQPPREIPPGYYDTGDGFYNPKSKVIYTYKSIINVKRAPSVREQKWIVDNCRREPLETIGPRPDLYETWLEPAVVPEPLPPPLAGYRLKPRYPSIFDCMEVSTPPFYDSTKLESMKYPCTCQGLCLMRKFGKKHEEKCETQEVPEPPHKTTEFLTGSTYDGEWQVGCGMHGYGVYTFTNGVTYKGEFKYGSMHGKGELRYQTPDGMAIIRGQWRNSVMIERTLYLDDDTLKYVEDGWDYCKIPDRRYSVEYIKGLQPAGNSYLTAYKPPIEIPEGCYDTGDGFYHPKTKMIYENHELTTIVRYTCVKEQQWILENCRTEEDNIKRGPRPDLYEEFIQPTMRLAPESLPTDTRTNFKKSLTDVPVSKILLEMIDATQGAKLVAKFWANTI